VRHWRSLAHPVCRVGRSQIRYWQSARTGLQFNSMKRIALCVALHCACVVLRAQSPPDAPQPSELQAIVSAQFGPQFVLLENFPLLTGDFNHDGSEDAVFVAAVKGGLQGESGRFRLLDPSNEYFGVGDPKITQQFASPYPEGHRYVLIIHGNGKDGWRAKEPKEKFVLINLAFDHLSVGHMMMKKKKMVDDIGLEETGVLNSFLYWNGRLYKWQPGDSEM